MKTKKDPARIVITNRKGQPAATAPASAMAPMRMRMQKLLVPYDFSEPSEKALRYAMAFAEQFDARLYLVHVVQPVYLPVELGQMPLVSAEFERDRYDRLTKELEERAAHCRNVGIKPEVHVISGAPWREIVEIARSREIDLIILATHGHTGLKHALLGSVAERVVRHAPCPVLVVREHEHEFV